MCFSKAANRSPTFVCTEKYRYPFEDVLLRSLFRIRQVSSNGKMTICGTDEYMAPEMLFDESFSYPADMFSFGGFNIFAGVGYTRLCHCGRPKVCFTVRETTLLRLNAVRNECLATRQLCMPLTRAKLRLLKVILAQH